jgi:hypothetical protein
MGEGSGERKSGERNENRKWRGVREGSGEG